jgi:hypothetical protein
MAEPLRTLRSRCCSLLTTADSQNTIFLNLIGSMTINSVTCFSDAGAPTVNIQRNEAGTLTNILSANLTCSTTGATSSSSQRASST